MTGIALALAVAALTQALLILQDAWHHSPLQAAHATHAIHYRLHGTRRADRTVWTWHPKREPCHPKLVVLQRETPIELSEAA